MYPGRDPDHEAIVSTPWKLELLKNTQCLLTPGKPLVRDTASDQTLWSLHSQTQSPTYSLEVVLPFWLLGSCYLSGSILNSSWPFIASSQFASSSSLWISIHAWTNFILGFGMLPSRISPSGNPKTTSSPEYLTCVLTRQANGYYYWH